MKKELERKFIYDLRGTHICRISDEEKGEINKNAVSFNYGKLKEYMIFIKKMVIIVLLYFVFYYGDGVFTRPCKIQREWYNTTNIYSHSQEEKGKKTKEK